MLNNSSAIHRLLLAVPEADGLGGAGARYVKPSVAVGCMQIGAVVGGAGGGLTDVPEWITHGDGLLVVFPDPRTFLSGIRGTQPVMVRQQTHCRGGRNDHNGLRESDS